MDFLPVNKADLAKRGWDEVDIIIVSADAYVDHPAWAAAILGRFLESRGYRVGVIAQPGWRSLEDICRLGKPRLFFAISGGNMDSMVNHYTADKKRRHKDLYSPGGQTGLRPDRPTIVYANLVRRAYPQVPIVIGGIEASLRRLAHYDYWSNKVRRSILMDSRADLLVYGMGEYSLLEIAARLQNGEDIGFIRNLRGTCYVAPKPNQHALKLPSYEEIAADRQAFAQATRIIYEELNPYCARPLAQKHGNNWVIQNPPAMPLSTRQLDDIYKVPFTRRFHPMYTSRGGVPGLNPVQFSIVSHRGCFGGCAFCSIGLHQGKFIQQRSMQSIVDEAGALANHADFKGTIPDVGAPSANMYGLKGIAQDKCRKCRRISCLFPGVCKNLNTDHSPSVKLWQRLRAIKGIKHIFVSSGIRYDLILRDISGNYLRDLCRYHTGGQLKIAPEHISDRVTNIMRKPGKKEYIKFIQKFYAVNQKLGREQYIIPYFISAHPGCSLQDTVELAEFVRDYLQYYPEQVQNFTPTPMTISTCMYFSGLDPVNGTAVYVPREEKERKWQRALLQYRSKNNKSLVREALRVCHREDLIGSSPRALVNSDTVATNSSRKHRWAGKKPKPDKG
ncbi:MAG: YgiQ family radical SAM protein [Syntrophomonadaceae bacterium]|jgi:uncharacterized radical SAM protein YgiQ